VSEQQGIYGIDLGTTYSAVAYIDETGRPTVVRNTDGEDTTPSVVYFESQSNVVVGKTAKASAGVSPDEVVSLIKREMGNKDFRRTFYGQEFSASAISALILGALAQSAQEETGRPVHQVVITVPAYFGLLEKDATKKAGEMAGLEVIGIVPEPVAAALSYGITGTAEGTTFVVYDLGGGTFDATLIKMTDTSVEVLGVDGDHRLGGADWDSRLFEYFKEQVIEQSGDDSIEDDESSLQELRLLAEETKKALTKAETRKVNYRYNGLATSITVTRAQFEEMTSDLLEETIRITNRMLEEAEKPGRFPDVRGQINAFLLVGGSSKMPAVTERVRKEYPWDTRLADPDLAVAKGAALYAAGQTVRIVDAEATDAAASDSSGTEGSGRSRLLPAGPPSADAIAAVSEDTGLDPEVVEKLASKTIVNMLPKAVGIKVAHDKPDWDDLPEDEQFYIDHLVPAQTQLPYRAEKWTGATMVAYQESIQIEIWEQDGAVPAEHLSANHRVDNAGRIEGLRTYQLPAGSDVDIYFDVDAEGTVNLLAVEPVSGKELRMTVKISIMSEEQVGQQKALVAGFRKGM
jgi:molecular chaperone DnaK